MTKYHYCYYVKLNKEKKSFPTYHKARAFAEIMGGKVICERESK